MLIYGYARVSTREQNLDRQLVELKQHTDKIYADKESGKNFDRPEYAKLMKKLKKNDTLIIKSIDRLGRNYDLILEQWRIITHEKQANIKVLDMPLLDTTKTEGLTGKFIADLVLQILSYVAEQERNSIKTRQAEGIRIAREKGIKFGRPKIDRKPVYEKIQKYYLGEIKSLEEIAEMCDISRPTLFMILREYKKENSR